MDAAFLFPRGAKKLPAANLLLLRQLLALLRLIGQHVSSSRMTCSSLAICLGPKLLSPPQEEQLELEAMLARNKKVNALVDFTLENSGDIFGEQVAGPSESPAPTELCTEMHREEQSGPAGREDDKPQAESDPDASPSLPETRQGDGEEATVLEVQRAEAASPRKRKREGKDSEQRPGQKTGNTSQKGKGGGHTKEDWSNAGSSGSPRSPAPLSQNLGAASPEDSELPPGPSSTSAGSQEREAFPATPRKVFATSRLLEDSSEDTHRFLRQPELIIPLVAVDHQSLFVALPESSSCTSSEQHTPAYSPSATPGSSAPNAPPGSAGWAAWMASSWAWNSPGEEELPPLDLELVLETLEEMLSPSLPERSPFAQDNLSVAPESSGGEAGNRAAAEGALPGTESCGNSSPEPEEPDIHLIYLSRRAALRGRKGPRESL
ncbi:rho GTPase-activating protein 44-like [Corvus moneduloides]|uniref:rho GTPase-activating protein 44-like n=1 Tax=Corvus moneduloides TaxID=1196302 RepID=UPI0013637AC4|nr:rho GTPase-activating protein 44-like [Corvus moneduloides]